MSSESVICISGISKSFPVYEKPHHRLMQMLRRGGAKHSFYKEFHALRHIDFEIRKGEALGILGRNGSGKSTLLQIICGILTPSHGEVIVRGRIAALLELGAGFNPDFTGRENVYLNGSVLGLTRSEIDARFDEIAAFADIGDFIEQPVKSYSSGMYVRLAFSVAINATPDILVVDEALSVGDEAFQRKCYARINSIRDAGATILFVSHSSSAVIELCDRAVLLDQGEMLAEGTPKAVVARYQKLLYAPSDRLAALREDFRREVSGERDVVGDMQDADSCNVSLAPNEQCPTTQMIDDAYLDQGLKPQSTIRYPSRGARIGQPRIETLDGRIVNVLRPGHDYVYVYDVAFDVVATAVRCGMMIKTVSGFELGGAASAPVGGSKLIVSPGEAWIVRIQFKTMMAPGVYFMNAGVTAHDPDGDVFLDRIVDAVMVRVMPDECRLATGTVDFAVVPSMRIRQGSEVEHG